MRLLRNDPKRQGICKYALVRLDKLSPQALEDVIQDQGTLIHHITESPDLIELGLPGDEEEFFAIKLKDENAKSALLEYAYRARVHGDNDFAKDVERLADRAGNNSKFCKKPD